MTILSQLPKTVDKRRKRIGRGVGSGKGAKSTRGTTRHQKAREKIPLHFEGGQAKMVKKYPLLRGKGKNKSVRQRAVILSLTSLNAFKEGEVVDLATIMKRKMIPAHRKKMYSVKIVANGSLKKKLTVRLPVSKHAKKIIEKAGGSVESV